MVRNYVRKTNRGNTYSKEDLQRAMDEVRNGIITAYRASKKYKIPMMTLNYHLRGIRGKKSRTQGRHLAIPIAEEEKLARGLKTMEKWGWGLTRKEVLGIVGQYVRRNNMKTPFKNCDPGEYWYLGFAKRHNLSIKKPQSVEYTRKKSMDPFIINNYFKLLEKALELNLRDIPHCIWNLDESSFCQDPSKTKVVGNKGTPASRTTAGAGRENIIVLMAANAAGYKAAPLLVFKGKIYGTSGLPLIPNIQVPPMPPRLMDGWSRKYSSIISKTVF